jgi:Fe-S cluster assembly protein SufB
MIHDGVASSVRFGGRSRATVSKIEREQLFYLMCRGISESEASEMIVSGFVEPLAEELPLCYAQQLNELIRLQMNAAVG